MMRRTHVLAAAAAVFTLGLMACDQAPVPSATAAPRQEGQQEGRSQQGQASYYGPQFNGRRMANGEPFNPNSNSAAHRTLPLGTTARVTNLENGRSATVKVEDRGPYARHRVIDVSPRTAKHLGMKEEGTAPVRVTPIDIPDRAEGRKGQQEAQRQ